MRYIRRPNDLVCECCGKEYSPSQQYGDTGYIAHRNICESYNMSCFVSRFNSEKSDDKKWEEVLDHLDISYDDGGYMTYEFIMDAFNCMVKSLRNGMVESLETKSGYKAYPEIAKFMESRSNLIKDQFNSIIKNRIEKVESKMNQEIQMLKGLLK